jgi:6-phosphogluconate dehydrogenase (decarboxylating)
MTEQHEAVLTEIDFADKILSAMRSEVGDHNERPTAAA